MEGGCEAKKLASDVLAFNGSSYSARQARHADAHYPLFPPCQLHGERSLILGLYPTPTFRASVRDRADRSRCSSAARRSSISLDDDGRRGGQRCLWSCITRRDSLSAVPSSFTFSRQAQRFQYPKGGHASPAAAQLFLRCAAEILIFRLGVVTFAGGHVADVGRRGF